jgi:hypothetical protein
LINVSSTTQAAYSTTNEKGAELSMDGSAMLLCLLLPVAARCRSLLTISFCCQISSFFPVLSKYPTQSVRQKLEIWHHFPRRYRAAAVVRRRCKVPHEGNVEHVDVAD